MPFGLCNAGATFQRLMDIAMSGLNLEMCLVYLDDIVVYARTPEEHLQRLAVVFERLSRAGLKVKLEKCRFFQRSVRFLGHVISHEGIGTDPEKTRAVVEWPTPTSATEVRSFLGLASYYRRFVKDFAKLASQLHELTRKDIRFQWSPEAQQAFDALKVVLTSPPVLAMPNDIGEFVLDTDASDRTIGAVLPQRQDGGERIIAYASRSLDRRETNYCCTRRELLAIVHFLKYFKQYLLGRTFRVRTDHSALTWLRRTSDRIGQQTRWLEQLEEFDFAVEHCAGTKQGNADALSRRPCVQKNCACTTHGQGFSDGPADHLTLRAAAIAVHQADNTELKSRVGLGGTPRLPPILEVDEENDLEIQSLAQPSNLWVRSPTQALRVGCKTGGQPHVGGDSSCGRRNVVDPDVDHVEWLPRQDHPGAHRTRNSFSTPFDGVAGTEEISSHQRTSGPKQEPHVGFGDQETGPHVASSVGVIECHSHAVDVESSGSEDPRVEASESSPQIESWQSLQEAQKRSRC